MTLGNCINSILTQEVMGAALITSKTLPNVIKSMICKITTIGPNLNTTKFNRMPGLSNAVLKPFKTILDSLRRNSA